MLCAQCLSSPRWSTTRVEATCHNTTELQLADVATMADIPLLYGLVVMFATPGGSSSGREAAVNTTLPLLLNYLGRVLTHYTNTDEYKQSKVNHIHLHAV